MTPSRKSLRLLEQQGKSLTEPQILQSKVTRIEQKMFYQRKVETSDKALTTDKPTPCSPPDTL